MTSAHPIRRVLARICSTDTMARIVDPTLADMRWESGHPACFGYLALARALTLHAITSTPGMLGRVYTDDGHAIPKIVGYSITGALVLAVPLMAPPVLDGWIRRVIFPGFRPNEVPSLLALLLLLPQALALTLPAALLMAIPLGLSRHRPSPRLTRRTIGLSMCCAAVTFVMMAWVMPEANQAFRVLISGDQRLVRGPSENGFAKMRREIERLRTFHGGETVVRRLTFGYQQRLALAVTPIPLGLFALAITVSAKGRRRPWLVGAAGLAFYLFVFYPVMALGQYVLARSPAIPVLVLAWAPNALVLLVAALLHPRKHSLPGLTTRH